MQYNFNYELQKFERNKPLSFSDIDLNIQKDIILISKNLYDNFNIESIYLYGSTLEPSRFQKGFSDLDLLVINDNTEKIITLDMIESNIKNQLYKTFSSIEIENVNINTLYNGPQKNAYAFILKFKSVLLYGRKIHDNLIEPQLGYKLIDEFCGDYESRINKQYILFKKVNDKEKKKICKWIMKRIIRMSHILLVNKISYFTDTIQETANFLIKYYPEKQEEIENILNLIHNPTTDLKTLDNVMENYYNWIDIQWKGIFYSINVEGKNG